MHFRTHQAIAQLLVAFGFVVPAHAADAADGPMVSVYSGAEIDDDSGTRLDLGVSISTTGGTTWSLSGARADVDSVAGKLVSTGGSAQIDHDFGRFGLRGGVRQVEDEDFSESLTWLAGAYADFDLSRIGAVVERRDIDMDETTFTVAGSDLGLNAVDTVTGRATCSLTSTGYGLSGMHTRQRWSLYGSAIQYDYSGYDCTSMLDVLTTNGNNMPVTPGSRAPIAVRRPVIFKRVARNATRTFDGLSASRIPRETSLLESTLMLGFEAFATSRTTIGAEGYRDADEFAEASTTTLLAYVDWRATEVISLTTTLGTSDSDAFGRLQFLGLRLTAYFGTE
jgi:hypothetical protein